VTAPAEAGPAADPGSRRTGRLRLLAGIVLGLPLLWLVGLVWFADTMPSAVADPDGETDAIVVLTGGSQRLEAGLTLLAAGKAKKLFVSGVHRGVAIGDLLHALHQAPSAAVACCIELGHDADSTYGNAVETASWMRREGFASLRLVTASYHMRRSLFEFGRAMPAIRMIAHPVFPERVRLADWWESPGTAALIVEEYDKYLGARLRAALGLAVEPAEFSEETGGI
jgi:uncharacterized SAM-binding protein YcdF (DUF218 family)